MVVGSYPAQYTADAARLGDDVAGVVLSSRLWHCAILLSRSPAGRVTNDKRKGVRCGARERLERDDEGAGLAG